MNNVLQDHRWPTSTPEGAVHLIGSYGRLKPRPFKTEWLIAGLDALRQPKAK